MVQCFASWFFNPFPFRLFFIMYFLQFLYSLSSVVSSEVGRAVWLRFSPPLPSSGPQPSFMAHLSGAVVGISMGLLILRSYEESLQKQCSWWVIVFSFITFLLFAIFWNIFAYELLGVQIPPPPWWRPCAQHLENTRPFASSQVSPMKPFKLIIHQESFFIDPLRIKEICLFY